MAQVIDARVNWFYRYANTPMLEIVVDRIPDPDEFVYEIKKLNDVTVYFSEKEGFVSF